MAIKMNLRSIFRFLCIVAIFASPMSAMADNEDPPLLPSFGADNITADGSILYVSTLASCTQQLVTSVCSSNSCPDTMPTDINDQCAVAAAAPPPDPCAADATPVYNTGLHVGALFIIIFTSALGTVLPILGKYHTFFNIDAYILCLGKCLGIGILLACALVHMLQPANQELTSACLGPAFTDDYSAYAYLFAMLAIMLMQFIDFCVEQFLVSRMEERLEREAHGHGHGHGSVEKPKKEEGPEAIKLTDVKPRSSAVASEESSPPGLEKPDTTSTASSPNSSPVVCVHMEIPTTDVTSYGSADISNQHPLKLHAHQLHPSSSNTDQTDHVHKHDDLHKKVASSVHDHDDHEGHEEGHSHVHSVLLIKGLKRTISAWLLEFGVSVHSVFIGLTTGITGEAELKVLLVALSFHQCFEGVALGSRIAEANMNNVLEEVLMVLIFVLSAPIGMAVGIGVTHSLNPNGLTYNVTAGTFDGVCAGILLYIGLSLLLKDFPADMKKYAKTSPLKKFGLFFALWVGGGVMAFIGRYL